MKSFVFGVLFLAVAFVPASAQVASASLFGEAKDQAAARIPGVKVTARHLATGFSRAVVTSDEGSYRIDELLPGAYTVVAEKAGFRALTVQSVLLEVNQKAKLDMQLQVGTPAESVTVVSDLATVQASDASVGYR